MKNPYSSQEYEIVENTKRISNFIKIITVLILIIEIVIIYKFNYKVYIKSILLKYEDYYTLSIPIDEIDLLNSKEIYINNLKYNYEIYKSEINNLNNILYETVYIKIKEYDSNLDYTNCFILKSNKSIFDFIVKFIEGGSK